MDSPTLARPVGRSAPTDRAATVAVAGFAGLGPALAVAVCLWSMVQTPFTGAPAIQPGVTAAVAAASLVSLALAVWRGISTMILLLAISLGLSVATASLGGVVHQFPDTTFVPAAMGLAVAAAAAAAAAVPPRVIRALVLLVLGAVVWLSLALGVADVLGSQNSALYERGERSWLGVLQLGGIPGHPNGMALFASLALLLQSLALLASQTRSAAWRIAAFVAGPAAAGAALIWSQSRTGLLCAVAVIALLVIVKVFPRRSWLTPALLGTAALSSAVPPLLTLAGFSFHGRWFPWSIAWQQLQGNWLLGQGPEVFSPEFWDRWVLDQPAWWEPAHAHNQILASLVMLGLVGLAILVAAVVVMILIASRSRFLDGGWAIAVCGVMFINAGPENVLGVADIGATYLPVLVVAAVLAASWTIASPGSRQAPEAAQSG